MTVSQWDLSFSVGTNDQETAQRSYRYSVAINKKPDVVGRLLHLFHDPVGKLLVRHLTIEAFPQPLDVDEDREPDFFISVV